MLRKISLVLTDKLPWWVVIAGVAGFIASPFANGLSFATSPLLVLMMVGSGLSLALPQVFEVRGSLRLTILTLVVQLSLLPILSYCLYLILPNPILTIGILAVGVAPSEITSALMTMVAGGKLALAMRIMAFSIFLSVFLTPFWLGLFLGKSLPLDLGSMVVELGLIIALPFLIASGVRTRFPKLENHNDEFGGLSALAVIILIFVVGGSIATFQPGFDVVWLILACILFNLCGYLLGFALGRINNLDLPQKIALIFTSGMREFGIATAVALNFLPPGAALAPALYGLIMMLSASILASRFKKRSLQSEPVNVLNERVVAES